MTGIQFVTDEHGEQIAVRTDLAIHGELWEDLQDVLVSQERRAEKGIPIEKVKASRRAASSTKVYNLFIKPSGLSDRTVILNGAPQALSEGDAVSAL